jgi:putative ABC transport system ATP-binding protein
LDSLIRLDHVSKRFHSGLSSEICPLNSINLKIDHGERIILLGKSGSGKTTFLNLVGGVDVPTSGDIFFDGQKISNMSHRELAQYRRKEVGFIFQAFNLFSTLSVGENLMLPLEFLGISDEDRARDILRSVGLEGQWNKFPEQLSGGEQQRVAIARALVKNPRVILADEPTGNLDLETGNSILELIYEICKGRKATLIMVTHSSEALWLADRIFTLKSGKLLEEPAKAGPGAYETSDSL